MPLFDPSENQLREEREKLGAEVPLKLADLHQIRALSRGASRAIGAGQCAIVRHFRKGTNAAGPDRAAARLLLRRFRGSQNKNW
jgi:hypothetical protein